MTKYALPDNETIYGLLRTNGFMSTVSNNPDFMWKLSKAIGSKVLSASQIRDVYVQNVLEYFKAFDKDINYVHQYTNPSFWVGVFVRKANVIKDNE